ncbi:MAG: glycosyltransferase [Rhodothermaceae bacterium]
MLASLSEEGYKSFCITYEKLQNTENEIETINRIKNKYLNKITFFENRYKSKKIIPNWILRIITMTKQTRDIIKNHKIDIVHTRSLIPSVMALTALMFTTRKVKFIYDNRGVLIEEEIYRGNLKKNGIITVALKLFELKIMRKADAMVVVSKKFKEYISEAYTRYIPDIVDKTVAITNGTDISDLPENIIQHKKRDKISVVYSGSAMKWQYLPGIKKFVAECRKNFKEIEINILTYDYDQFYDLLKGIDGFGEKIILQTLESHQVKEKLMESNFAIMIRERNLVNKVATPVKFAEYLSAGLPVFLSSGIGDTEDIINRNKIGVVVDENKIQYGIEEMINLLKDENIYQRCIDTVKKELDLQNSIDKYIDLYSKL